MTLGNGAVVNASGLITGDANFVNAGLVASITGGLGIVNLTGGTVDVDVNVATVNFKGADTIKGASNAVFNVTAAADATATGLMTGSVTYSGVGTLTANGGIAGDIDFANQAGTLKAGGLITGNVDSTGGANGMLEFTAVGGVNGTINNLALVNFNSGAGIDLTGNAAATDFKFLANDTVTANGTINGDIDFNGKNGILNARALITGDVDNLLGGGNSTLNFTGLNGGVDGKIGNTNALHAINIKSGAKAVLTNEVVKADTITIGELAGAGELVRGGDVNFDLNNGVNTVFEHKDSKLILKNDAAGDHTITLYGNLGNALADDHGILHLKSKEVARTLTLNRNVAETIGVDNLHRMQELIIDGLGKHEINPEVFAKKLTLNAPEVSFVNGLDQGTGGRIDVNRNVMLYNGLKNLDRKYGGFVSQ